MHFEVVAQCADTLKLVDNWLDKAVKFAGENKIDIDVLLQGRLAPDMKPLIYQVQSACDYVKAGAAWLSGQTPPKHEDTEKTLGELRERIRKTIAFVDSVERLQYADAENRKVRLSWAPGKYLKGDDYLLQMTIPNSYFHISMVYAILRNAGVNVGKMDFLGAVNFVVEN